MIHLLIYGAVPAASVHRGTKFFSEEGLTPYTPYGLLKIAKPCGELRAVIEFRVTSPIYHNLLGVGRGDTIRGGEWEVRYRGS